MPESDVSERPAGAGQLSFQTEPGDCGVTDAAGSAYWPGVGMEKLATVLRYIRVRNWADGLRRPRGETVSFPSVAGIIRPGDRTQAAIAQKQMTQETGHFAGKMER
jgi:hypothetical protein